jgi:GT2 family glycosyltransferase/tetratricopeptide (TPR) repeat protein/2-polyprenyl-3-methyl-5-hydroxy-6-metoxy-1,4-benzoquinol methylase
MAKVAVIYDHLSRPETTGVYCLRALAEIAQVEQFHPSQLSEVRRGRYNLHIFVDDGFAYAIPGDLRPQVFWAIDTHIDFGLACKRAADADFVFAAQRNGAERLTQFLGRKVEWLPLACDRVIHVRQDVAIFYNLSFVGNLVGKERMRLIRILQSEIPEVHVGRHYFEEMAAVYSASRLVFNRSVVDDINMRVFEALCSGSLLITNNLEENGQGDLFQESKHLVTYSSDEELLDKVRYYLKNEAVRARIAAAGQQEVIAKHTYRHRMERLLLVASSNVQVKGSSLDETTRLGADPHYFEFSRPEILALIPNDAKYILDVGCGAGELGRALKKRQNCTVYGVEINEGAAERASAYLDRVWTGDIESIELDLAAESIDVIVCGDILEHLRAPREVLRRLSEYFRRDGQLVASIPNVAHHTVIRGLLAGNWTYEPSGLLDETHLRFFTANEIEKLFFRARLRIEKMESLRWHGEDSRFAEDTEGQIRLGPLLVSGLSQASIDKLSIHQYLLSARPVRTHATRNLTSIVILTHNQLDYTKLCLASIRSRTDEPYEIIVVDNASIDGTVEYLRAMNGVQLIGNSENRGFPAAVNQGIKEARGDYILLLNNDCIVTTGWLTRLLEAINSAPEIGLAGPCSNCVSGEQKIPVGYELLTDLDGFAWDWGKRHLALRVMTDRLVGFCLLLKRSVIDRVGLLDERFGLGNFEDDDFCRRAREAGFKAVIAQDSFVHHFGSITYRAMGSKFGSLLDHNRQLFEEKWERESEPEHLSSGPEPQSARSKTMECAEPGLLVGSARPRVSLCMIVRDSALTLGDCLKSIRPWVDEIVVVDTGSKDATPAIASSYGAKVFHFPWCDDFSAARNESLSHASGEWLLWMDSDDTIDQENGRKLRELVDGAHKPEVVGYVAQVHCPHENDGEDYTAVDHVKLFRNLPELRFEGRVHEQILPAINRLGGSVAWTDIFVVHSGSDQSLEGQAKKLYRDLKLLILESAERSDHPFTLFNLGMTYLEMKRLDEAARCLDRSIAVAAPQESHLPKAYSLLVQALAQNGQMDKAWQRCQEGVGRYPDDPELCFRTGVLARDYGRFEYAERYYLKILEDTREHKFRSIDQGILGYKTRQNLACLYNEQGRHAAAEENWRMILAERPDRDTAWRGLLTSLLKQDKVLEARKVLSASELISRQSPLCQELEAIIEEAVGNFAGAQRILEKAVADAPDHADVRDALCRFLYEHGSLNEAESALKTFVGKFPDNAAALYNLATVHLRQGRFAEAAESYEASLALRPNWPPAYEHLTECYHQLGRDEEADAALAKANQFSRPQQRIQMSNSAGTPPTESQWFCSADELADAVDICIQAAEREESKLSDAVLSVPGMTSRRIRHLLNQLGGLPGCRFLEVGTLCGATSLAASYDNPGMFISVDDFSEFNESDLRPTLHENLSKFSGHSRVDFREQDCWTLASKLPRNSVNVYFYDGAHTREAHQDALLRFAKILTDPFVLLIDDWNMTYVQEGTREALEKLGWSMHRQWHRTTDRNGDTASWWNGLLIAVVTKKKHVSDSVPASNVRGRDMKKPAARADDQAELARLPSVCLVACYFGPPPPWIDHYLLGCAYNPSIDFLIFTDQEDCPRVPPNVRIERLSLESFNALATQKLGLEISLSHPRKVCDFKPAYGHIFEEFLSGQDYWGYTDLDVIYGDLRHFLTAARFHEYDVFTARAEYLVGHCTIWRNSDRMRTLYQQSADHRTTFQFPEVLSFDECGEQWAKRWQGELLDNTATCDSMTHLVHRLMCENKISACFSPAVIEWPEIGAADWRLRWHAGRLWSIDQQREAMYVHFHVFKDRLGYREPCTIEGDSAFEISPDGFHLTGVPIRQIGLEPPVSPKSLAGNGAYASTPEGLAPTIVRSNELVEAQVPIVLTAFDRRHLTLFLDRFLATLRATGNNEVVMPVAIGLHPSEREQLSQVPDLRPLFYNESDEHVARLRLRLFAEVTRALPAVTPVAYWDAGDVIFQSRLQPLWKLVGSHPNEILAVREPSGYPENPVVVQWTENITDATARCEAQQMLFHNPFLNAGFLAGRASVLAKYFETAAKWYSSPKLAGTTDPCDQTALNLFCHSRPEAWHEISDSWNYCLWGRITCYRREDGRYVDVLGVPIHVVHGNAHTLDLAPSVQAESEFQFSEPLGARRQQ